jgi:putative ABC transport system permease protein
MMRAGMAVLLAHWRRHPLQLAMLLLGLMLATALWTGVQAINAEARASYARAAATLAQDRLPRLVPAAAARFDQGVFVALRRAGWPVAPVLEGRLRVGEKRLTLIGIDPLTAPAPTGLGPITGAAGDGGLLRFITPPGEALANPATVAALAEVPLPGGLVLRAAEGLPEGTLITDIGIAQALLAAPGMLSRLLLPEGWPAAAPPDLPPFQAVAPGLVLEMPDGAGELARLTDSFHLNLTAFGLLAFAVGLFITHAAVGLAFEQRRATFRTLRALGLPARQLTLLLAAELGAVALVAGGAGVLLGWLVAALLLPDVAATLAGLYGAAVPGTVALRPAWVAAGLGLALAGTALAGAQAIWRIARLPPLAPARPRAWAMAAAAGLRGQALAALALAAAALVLATAGTGMLAGFALLGCLLLAAALALPVLLHHGLRGAERLARGPVAQWFVADTRQQLPGLSLALMALMLALATNVGVGTMVASFRATFTGWLDQRLAAELYVTARTPEEGARLAAFLADRAEAVLPIVSAATRIAGQPGQIFGFADHATYRDAWPLLAAAPGAWDRVAAGEAILVNEQAARRAGLGLGDLVAVSGVTLPVAGIYSDYGNPAAQAMVALPLFDRLHPGTLRLSFALRTAEAPALAAALAETFGLPAERIADQAAARALSLAVFERTFAVTAALNVLTLGVAGLALLASMLTLAGMRLPQLAPLWALGLTRARLARLELGRAVMLAAATAALALPVGLLLAFLLLAVINVQAFGWRLPMLIFPGQWAVLALTAVAAAALAAAWPAARIARLAPADLLRLFADER